MLLWGTIHSEDTLHETNHNINISHNFKHTSFSNFTWNPFQLGLSHRQTALYLSFLWYESISERFPSYRRWMKTQEQLQHTFLWGECWGVRPQRSCPRQHRAGLSSASGWCRTVLWASETGPPAHGGAQTSACRPTAAPCRSWSARAETQPSVLPLWSTWKHSKSWWVGKGAAAEEDRSPVSLWKVLVWFYQLIKVPLLIQIPPVGPVGSICM